ncbi:hypothetical protein HPT25_19350 [Bacillus sp. BRMEA1]|uniref:hypothetical protein n=1 Tax=Neobacillus endophyticus TaxID=2738405 RepID=UPI0015635414|nr:hypothetical protein [Neobacillus endophyticus]NRD79520.1 hypothetical protein [Neobacillus endophyticus]
MIFAPMVVNIGGIKVNTFDHASILNMGPNQFIDQFVSYKRNQGYGEQNGDVVPIIIPICTIYDSDFSDSWTGKASII